jgi:hypothetical protein
MLRDVRTAAHNKDVAMAKLDTSLTAMRAANHGRAAWLGKEVRCVKRNVGGRRGRPSLEGHLSEEDSDGNENDDDDDDESALSDAE